MFEFETLQAKIHASFRHDLPHSHGIDFEFVDGALDGDLDRSFQGFRARPRHYFTTIATPRARGSASGTGLPSITWIASMSPMPGYSTRR